jgi:hypothetical protein
MILSGIIEGVTPDSARGPGDTDMILLLWLLLGLMRLRGFLVAGIVIIVIGILALAFPDFGVWILVVGLLVIAVIALLDRLRR